MEIQVKTIYDQRALTAMARGLRKTVRRKRNRRSRIVGSVLMVLALLLGIAILQTGFCWQGVADLVVAVVLLAVLLTEDQVNGYFAGRKAMPGARDTETVFTEQDYVTTAQTAQTHWSYEGVCGIAEGKDYIVLALSSRHAQVYDKRGISGGTAKELLTLLQDKTGLPVTKM